MIRSWRWFFWGLVGAALVALIGLLWFDRYMDECIRSHVESQLADMYPQLKVSVRSARLVEGEGIIIRGVSLVQNDVAGPAAELLYCDEIYVECDTSLQELLTGQPDIRRFVLDRPRIRLLRLADGSCQLDKLWPRGSDQRRLALSGKIENGTLEWIDRETRAVFSLRDINLQVAHATAEHDTAAHKNAPGEKSPRKSGEKVAAAEQPNRPEVAHTQRPWNESPVNAAPASASAGPALSSAEGKGGQLPPKACPEPGRRDSSLQAVRIKGTFRGDHFQGAHIDFQCDSNAGTAAWEGEMSGLEISPELQGWLPEGYQGSLGGVLAQVRCRAKVSYRAQYDPSQREPWLYQVRLDLQRGRADDPRLPYSLSDIRGTIHVSPQGVHVENLVARSGQSIVELAGKKAGFAQNSPWQIAVRGQQVAIDRRVFEVLPEDWRATWNQFLPAGIVDVQGTLAYDGQDFSPDLQVRVLSGSFAHEYFPYRAERAYGDIRWTSEGISVDLNAFARTDKVQLKGQFFDPGPNVRGWLTAEGKGIRLDQDLIAALPEQARHVVTLFHASGAFDLKAHFWKEEGDQWFHQQFLIGILHASAQYEYFPFPLHNVRGAIEVRDDAWAFRGLTATNDSARITCDGDLLPSEQGNRLSLVLSAQDIPLEEELRKSLSEKMQHIWDELQPRGRIDMPKVTLNYNVLTEQLDVAVTATPRGDTASCEPKSFPWRLDKVHGTVHYRDGRADLKDMSGVHGETLLAWQGFAQATDLGGWQLHLDDLVVDHLSAERDLLSAMPESLRNCLTSLNPVGKVNLQGVLDLYQSGQPKAGLEAAWDMELFLRRNALQAGVTLENLFGSARFQGAYRGGQLKSKGELHLDSASWNGFQFTDVRGPFALENDRVLFGAPDAPQLDPEKFPHVTASIYGGTLYGDGWLVQSQAAGSESNGDETAKYSLRTTVRDMDLSRLAMEQTPGKQSYTGRLFGNLELSGTTEGLRALTGKGNAVMREANIYELPQMISLLKVARLQPPDPTAFTTANCDFHVQADHIYFDRLNLNGDAISLMGKGEMNFDKQIRLAFRTRAGREDASRMFPLVNQLIRNASSQFLMVNVTGTLDNPEIHSEPLPAVSEALQDLQDAAPGPQRTTGSSRSDGASPRPAGRLFP